MKIPPQENSPVNGPFLSIKIRIPVEDYERGLPYFGTRKKLNEFAVEAVKEKINRAVAYDKAARQRELETNMALLETVIEPVIKKLLQQGKLDCLKDYLKDI
jgi:hypothetical protein